ncbi:MAG TPA: hypothetical protein VGQ09_20115 [Chitinophagaceae bacterium]|jgi:hypothetical protein|nr:hypothetical protein [Chitinophagaceae bacterium]
MMYLTIRKITAVAAFTCITSFSLAQDPAIKTKPSVEEQKDNKPFRILTNGKRITIQSSKNITSIIVWTASGNRFIEQSNIEAPSYNFTIPSKEKYVFIMLELQGGKRYTEKIGVQ